MQEIVQVRNVCKEYGEGNVRFSALRGLTFEVSQGEFVAIMGPSGSGKTTLLNVMSTIDTAYSGEIWINGMKTRDIKDKNIADFRRENIGFVFQEFNLLDNMTVKDNIALPLALNNTPGKEIMKRILDVAQTLEIREQLDKYPYQLSGGQKQRAAISRAIITNPSIIFADEPTGALDSKNASELLTCFRNIIKKYSATIIMVTHDAVAASYCDRILFLKDGLLSGSLSSTQNEGEMYRNILNMLSERGLEGNGDVKTSLSLI